jgi:hypothetical protein
MASLRGVELTTMSKRIKIYHLLFAAVILLFSLFLAAGNSWTFYGVMTKRSGLNYYIPSLLTYLQYLIYLGILTIIEVFFAVLIIVNLINCNRRKLIRVFWYFLCFVCLFVLSEVFIQTHSVHK